MTEYKGDVPKPSLCPQWGGNVTPSAASLKVQTVPAKPFYNLRFRYWKGVK